MTVEAQNVTRTVYEALNIATQRALRYFRQSIPVDIKPDDSPVTLADREIEKAIRKLLKERFPAHAIFGEELF